jgi:hypothetical protein
MARAAGEDDARRIEDVCSERVVEELISLGLQTLVRGGNPSVVRRTFRSHVCRPHAGGYNA